MRLAVLLALTCCSFPGVTASHHRFRQQQASGVLTCPCTEKSPLPCPGTWRKETADVKSRMLLSCTEQSKEEKTGCSERDWEQRVTGHMEEWKTTKNGLYDDLDDDLLRLKAKIQSSSVYHSLLLTENAIMRGDSLCAFMRMSNEGELNKPDDESTMMGDNCQAKSASVAPRLKTPGTTFMESYKNGATVSNSGAFAFIWEHCGGTITEHESAVFKSDDPLMFAEDKDPILSEKLKKAQTTHMCERCKIWDTPPGKLGILPCEMAMKGYDRRPRTALPKDAPVLTYWGNIWESKKHPKVESPQGKSHFSEKKDSKSVLQKGCIASLQSRGHTCVPNAGANDFKQAYEKVYHEWGRIHEYIHAKKKIAQKKTQFCSYMRRFHKDKVKNAKVDCSEGFNFPKVTDLKKALGEKESLLDFPALAWQQCGGTFTDEEKKSLNILKQFKDFKE